MKIPKSVLFLTNAKNPRNYTKVALFDLDGTIVNLVTRDNLSKSSIWPFWNESVRSKMKDLYNKRHLVGIISNQAKLGERFKAYKQRIQKFLKLFDFPIFFMASLDFDFYRKPLPGMFDLVTEMYFNGKRAEGLFVGDAAGRLTKPIDHSKDDFNFALNSNLDFYTPDSFFCNPTYQFTQLPFDHQKYRKINIFQTAKKNIILLGKGKFSGKKHFKQKSLKNYVFYDNVQTFDDIENIVSEKQRCDFVCVLLDYSHEELGFLKTFAKLTKKVSTFKLRSLEINKFLENKDTDDLFLEKTHIELIRIQFCFDDSNYTELEKKISKFYLT